MPDYFHPHKKDHAQQAGVVCLRSTSLSSDPRTKRFAGWLREAGYRTISIGWDRLGDTPGPSPDSSIILAQIPASYGGGMRLLWPLVRWQWFLLKWLFCNRKRFDVIQAADLDTALPALVMRLVFGKKLVYDIHDYYIDSHIMPALLKSPLKRLEDFVISNANGTIIVSESRRGQLKDARPRLLQVVANVPERSETTAQADDSTAKLRLIYVGILVDCRGVIEMCEVIKSHPDWRLDIGGRGPAESEVRTLAEQSDNIYFYGRLEYSDTLALTERADCLIATYDPSIPNHRHSSPNKFGEALMCGKPLIVARGTGIDQLVEKHNVGFVVPYGDKVELERALAVVANWTDAERCAYGEHVRHVYRKHFSTEEMKRRLLSIYASVIEPGRSAAEEAGPDSNTVAGPYGTSPGVGQRANLYGSKDQSA
jgi:glycosyltransferase involved in cell wall biosynthesis